MNARMEAGFAKFKVAMDRDMGKMHGAIGEMHEGIVKVNKTLDRIDKGMIKRRRHVKGIYGGMFLGFIVYLIETSN